VLPVQPEASLPRGSNAALPCSIHWNIVWSGQGCIVASLSQVSRMAWTRPITAPSSHPAQTLTLTATITAKPVSVTGKSLPINVGLLRYAVSVRNSPLEQVGNFVRLRSGGQKRVEMEGVSTGSVPGVITGRDVEPASAFIQGENCRLRGPAC